MTTLDFHKIHDRYIDVDQLLLYCTMKSGIQCAHFNAFI